MFGWRLPVAGGGYFRLLPYAVTRWALRQLNGREGQPAMVYLHPWEIDPGQPRLPVGRLTRFRHSVNTGTTEAKLRRLASATSRSRRSATCSPTTDVSGRRRAAMKIVAVVGARPNFVKIAPIMAELAEYPYVTTTLVHTGQHYDAQMSDSFFANLEIPAPDVNLKVAVERAPSPRSPRS